MIAIDCRFAGGYSGLGRYTRELTEQMLGRADLLHFLLLVRPEAHAWIASLPPSPRFHVRTVDAAHYSLQEHVLLPHILQEEHATLLFAPHFTVPWHCPVPFVATIHDFILHRFPGDAPLWKRLAYRLLMRRTVHRARALITVSGFIRDELQTIYGPDAALRTSVIHEGVHPLFTPQPRVEQEDVCCAYGIDQPFFLYVGNAKQHKNVPFLLKAYAAAGENLPLLVLVSGGRETGNLHLPSRTMMLEHVPDADLPALYSAARTFVTASSYEGFCLPAVEALSCGCPVIAPRCPPFTEVLQGQAHLVEPDMDAFVGALRHPPSPPAAFRPPSWEVAAEMTVAMLQKALIHGSSVPQ